MCWWQKNVGFRLSESSEVILNSPWLRRSTGKALTILWISIHFILWCTVTLGLCIYFASFVSAVFGVVSNFFFLTSLFCCAAEGWLRFLSPSAGHRSCSGHQGPLEPFGSCACAKLLSSSYMLRGLSALFNKLFLWKKSKVCGCVLFEVAWNLSPAICEALKKKESLMQHLLTSGGIFLSSVALFSMNRFNIFYVLATKQECGIVSTFVVLCHCNVHPLGLFLGVILSFIIVVPEAFEELTLSRAQLIQWYVLVFLCLMYVAHSMDFTNRVRAVSSGMLFGSQGDNPLESPVAGRSGRSFCWLAAWSNWLLLVIMFWPKDPEHKAHHEDAEDAFALTMPISSTLALCLALIFSALATWKWKPFVEDMMIAYVCVAPTAVHLANSAHSAKEFFRLWQKEGQFHPSWFGQVVQSRELAWLMSTAETQVLIQAGCHPWICACAILPAIFNSIPSMSYHRHLTFQKVLTEMGSEMFMSILLASHCFDYFARMRAIRRGMLQSQENAMSSQNLSSNLDTSSSFGLELAFMQTLAKRLAVAMVFQDPSADSSSGIEDLLADFKRENLTFDVATWQKGVDRGVLIVPRWWFPGWPGYPRRFLGLGKR